MFDMLIESKPKKEKTLGQTVLSVVFHVVLVFAAVKATGVADPDDDHAFDGDDELPAAAPVSLDL